MQGGNCATRSAPNTIVSPFGLPSANQLTPLKQISMHEFPRHTLLLLLLTPTAHLCQSLLSFPHSPDAFRIHTCLHRIQRIASFDAHCIPAGQHLPAARIAPRQQQQQQRLRLVVQAKPGDVLLVAEGISKTYDGEKQLFGEQQTWGARGCRRVHSGGEIMGGGGARANGDGAWVCVGGEGEDLGGRRGTAGGREDQQGI